jgi:hypothetical protein
MKVKDTDFSWENRKDKSASTGEAPDFFLVEFLRYMVYNVYLAFYDNGNMFCKGIFCLLISPPFFGAQLLWFGMMILNQS